MKNWITFTFIITWLGNMLWCTSNRFIDMEITPKWFCAIFGTIIFIYTNTFKTLLKQRYRLSFVTLSWAIMLCVLSQAIYGLLQKCGICPIPSATLPMCGSFDNPAGLSSALAFALPFGLALTLSANRWHRFVIWTSIIIIIVALILSESRAGILSSCIIFLCFFLIKRAKTSQLFIWSIAATFAVLSVFLYLYKKDSANGRLLIWQCTWEIIKESPIIGHGSDGFEIHYMNKQADFFRQHPDSPYSLLADNVKSPFNEYLSLCVSYGFIGITILCAFVYIIYFAWKLHPYGNSSTSILCLLSVAIFSLFSYPFRYPHTWFFCIASICVLLHNAYPKLWHKSQLTVLSICTISSTVIFLQSISKIHAEMRWCEAANRSLCGLTHQMLPTYQELYDDLNNNPLFLYNYAAELNIAGQYAESYRIGIESEALMADYYTQLLQADNCKQMKRYDDAKHYLMQASFMCHNRFTPLYELFKIHQAEGNITGMEQTATSILRKSIKVDTPEVRHILSEINKFILNLQHK